MSPKLIAQLRLRYGQLAARRHLHWQLADGTVIPDACRDGRWSAGSRATRRLGTLFRLASVGFDPTRGQVRLASWLVTLPDLLCSSVWHPDTVRTAHALLAELFALIGDLLGRPVPYVANLEWGGDSERLHLHVLIPFNLVAAIPERLKESEVALPSGRAFVGDFRLVKGKSLWRTWRYMHKVPDSTGCEGSWRTRSAEGKRQIIKRYALARQVVTGRGGRRLRSLHTSGGLPPERLPAHLKTAWTRVVRGKIPACPGRYATLLELLEAVHARRHIFLWEETSRGRSATGRRLSPALPSVVLLWLRGPAGRSAALRRFAARPVHGGPGVQDGVPVLHSRTGLAREREPP